MNYYKGISISVRHLGQILDQAVKYFPEKIALRDDNEHEITFAELQEKTTRFAQNLVEQGVASGNIIMVVTEKYVEVVIIAISIWKAGGIFAPVDSKNPPDRIRLFSSNLRPFFIIASQIKLKELKDVIDCHNTISFSQVRSGVFYNFSEKQLPFVNSNDLAVILQTSGTTGKPKGVELEHGSVLVYFKGHRDICEISDKSKSINIGPFHYDVSIQNVFMPLYYGAFVYITKEIPHPSYILSIIERNKISHILCVATVLSIITGDGSILHEYDLSSVEMVSTGAEICNPEIIHIWLKLPNVKVNNTYGPAECNSASISYRIPKYINNDNQKIYPIGKPHPTVDFLLLDQKKILITKKDDPGMLYIGGAQLMRGYMDDVSETKRKIIDHKGKRYYKTGDLCFLDVEGNLNYVGRIDSEVNIFGRRINLTEIEKNYLKINGVNAASVGLVDVNNKKTISVVICIDEQLTVGDVHKELKSRLPYYMLPSYYGIIEKPVIGNTGKINGRKLLDLLSQSILSKDVICYNYENVDFYYYNEGREYFRGANEEGKRLEGSFPVRGGVQRINFL